MGCKAEGAAQGYTLLGGLVLIIFALNDIIGGLNQILAGNFDGVITLVLGIALLLMAILAFDACGFVYWMIHRNGLLLFVIGLVAIILVGRGLSFDPIGWLMNVGTLAGLMILLAGILIITKS
ncbi:MAG: conserved membrane protein of unknown function [Candidatus Thorarchaeota archaeon]|nr:MAG: conserved membrane protein of unknown function [Candidatus Thorarchaeota archaeon]